ncbi:MAG: MarC family protein [Candidatus Thermoplasmatota archaeon]|nr:MarC family protein [Candidatus Thermoplasmatota archaeon]
MSSFILEFIKVFIPLFVVIDPFGVLVVFISMTSSVSTEMRKTIVNDAVSYGFLILLLFTVAGSYVLYILGISIQALEIAGGTILLIMGIQMVREGDRPKSAGGSMEHDLGIVPFATPLLAGPGSISLVIILSSGGLTYVLITVISLVILFFITYIGFLFADRIFLLMGEKNLKALTRIFGILVAAFAVQYFLDAIKVISSSI